MMDPDRAESAPPPPPGYVSPEAKKRFGWRVVVLLGAAGLLQFFVPLVVTLGIMGVSIVESVRSGALTRFQQLDSTVAADGQLYFLASDAGGSDCLLMSVALGQPRSAASVAASFPPGSPYDCPWAIVPDGAALWMVGGSAVARFDRGSVSSALPPTLLGGHCMPFSYRGRPAVLEDTGVYPSGPSDRVLTTFDGVDWRPGRRIPLSPPFAITSSAERFRVVADGDTLHLFVQDAGGNLHYAAVDAGAPKDSQTWEPVPVRASAQWVSSLDDGVPTVAIREQSMFTMSVHGWRREAHGWSHAFTQRVQSPGSIGLVDTAGTGRFDVIAEGVFKSVEVVHIDGASASGVDRYGGMWMLEPGNMLLVTWGIMLGMLPIALGTGALLSWWMALYRTREYEHEGRRVTLASPMRRGFAKILDRAVPMVPAGLATLVFGVKLSDATSPGFLRDNLLFSAVVGAWWLLWIGAMSFLEGRWGQTPGKRLLGIRVVGLDLAPCGFWRALIRNLLELIDALFTYTVGLLAIAFSKSWQRTGDAAAKTLVVDVRAAAMPR